MQAGAVFLCFFSLLLSDAAPIECLPLEKKHSKNKKQPDAVRAVVDAVASAPDKDLAPLLENFKWTFEKVTERGEREREERREKR